MPKRLTTKHLADRIDGLGLAFFTSVNALVTTLIEVHPAGAVVIERMREEALGMLTALEDSDQDVFPASAFGHAALAVVAAFVSREGEDGPSNDNG